MELKSTQHGYGQNTYHLVFVPKCRYKYFMYPGIKSFVSKAFMKLLKSTTSRFMHLKSSQIMCIYLSTFRQTLLSAKLCSYLREYLPTRSCINSLTFERPFFEWAISGLQGNSTDQSAM